MTTEGFGQSSDSLYGRLAEVRPTRTDIEPMQGIVFEDDGGGSLSQRMRGSPKMSDTQVVDKRLFPPLKDAVEWLNHLMVGRVFPEQLIPLKRIIGKHLLKEYNDMSVAEATVLADVAVSIAIDGEGRMDIIHLFSKLSETTEEKDKAKI